MRRILALAALAVQVPAAELVVRDVFLDLALAPTGFSYELSDDAGERSGDDDFDSAYGIAAGVAYSFAGAGRSHGPVGALALTWTDHAYADGGGLTDLGLRLQGGWAWAIADRWTVAGLVGVGGGTSTIELPATANHADFDADGIFIAYGLGVQGTWAPLDAWIVRLEVGWGVADHALSASGEDLDLTLETSGLEVALGVAWRWSTRPWRLE